MGKLLRTKEITIYFRDIARTEENKKTHMGRMAHMCFWNVNFADRIWKRYLTSAGYGELYRNLIYFFPSQNKSVLNNRVFVQIGKRNNLWEKRIHLQEIKNNCYAKQNIFLHKSNVIRGIGQSVPLSAGRQNRLVKKKMLFDTGTKPYPVRPWKQIGVVGNQMLKRPWKQNRSLESDVTNYMGDTNDWTEQDGGTTGDGIDQKIHWQEKERRYTKKMIYLAAEHLRAHASGEQTSVRDILQDFREELHEQQSRKDGEQVIKQLENKVQQQEKNIAGLEEICRKLQETAKAAEEERLLEKRYMEVFDNRIKLDGMRYGVPYL